MIVTVHAKRLTTILAAFAPDDRFVEGHRVIFLGHVAGGIDRAAFGPGAFRAVQQLMLEDHHRIVADVLVADYIRERTVDVLV